MTAFSRPFARRSRRPDLRGRPHRHRSDLRRHPRAGRQLRPDRHQGDRARQGFRDEPTTGNGHAHSWALNVKSRTLRAEIDLPNTDSQLLPGMYAYAKVIIERPDVPGAADVRPDPQRRQDLLLDVRGWPRGANRDPDRRQRRRVDRGHQSPEQATGRPPKPGRRSMERNR